MATKSVVHRDVWGHEREGYSHERPTVAYAPSNPVHGLSAPLWLRWEERAASMTAGAGLVWGAHVGFTHLTVLDALWQTRGPIDLCAIAALIWLHAKWRRSTCLR